MFSALRASLPRTTVWLWIIFLTCFASAQSPSSPSSQTTPPSSTTPQKPDSDTEKSSDTKSKETKITPQQAEQLFRDVDTILDFASKDTTLDIRRGVKRRLTSREEVVGYLK